MYELTTLSNGLRVLTVTLPHVQSVALGFFLGVGSRYESDALAGASHFVEHMLFKGTHRRPSARDIAEAIEGRGGVFDATTGLESTLYWAKVAAPHLPEALDVLSDMLLHATFDADDVEKERAVIIEELKYVRETPDSLAQMLANQLQWPQHPLGRDVAGTRQSVGSLDRRALLGFRTCYYHPGSTVLAMAGQVDHGEAVALSERHLAGWRRGSAASFEPAPTNSYGPKFRVHTKDSEQVHLSFSFEGLARDDPDRFALRLLNVILGEGMRSRLFQEVRERLGLAYSVDSYLSTFRDSGALGIYGGVAVESVSEAIEAIVQQLDTLRQEPVSHEELEKACGFTTGRLALALENSFAVASWYAHQVLFGSEVLEPNQVIAHYESVQTQDIQRLARHLFQADRLNLAAVGPLSGDEAPLHSAVHL
jgi:predicted Zn-dependent peptidase